MPNLFTPLRIKDIELKNRIAVSPMCEYSSTDGFANDWHLVHLGSRAVGGAGLIITEATAVSPEGRISPHDLGIWKDDHVAELQKITNFISDQDAVAGIQLAHAGRKASRTPPWLGNAWIDAASGGWQTVSPGNIPFYANEQAPTPMSEPEIKKVSSDFKQAAIRSLEAGFRLIEIHAAHGYLINEFLSPITNKRTDDYGGSFENRIRLLFEVIESVREVWPEKFPLFVRISASDWLDEGWSIEDSVKLAEAIKHKGVDLIDCSSGGIAPDVSIPAAPGYQVPFAETIKKRTGLLTGAVGIIVNPAQAEEIITREKADIVLLAREMLRDPYFPMTAARYLGYDIKWPVQYERAKRKTDVVKS